MPSSSRWFLSFNRISLFFPESRAKVSTSFRSKVLPINSPLNCKLTNCYKKGIKSKNDRNTHISNLKVVDGRNGNDSSSVNTLSSSSLSVPLGFKFEFSSDVVAYRIDVETLALDSGKNNDILLKDKNHRDEEGTLNPSQLYLRRSVRTSSTSQIYFSLFPSWTVNYIFNFIKIPYLLNPLLTETLWVLCFFVFLYFSIPNLSHILWFVYLKLWITTLLL